MLVRFDGVVHKNPPTNSLKDVNVSLCICNLRLVEHSRAYHYPSVVLMGKSKSVEFEEWEKRSYEWDGSDFLSAGQAEKTEEVYIRFCVECEHQRAWPCEEGEYRFS